MTLNLLIFEIYKLLNSSQGDQNPTNVPDLIQKLYQNIYEALFLYKGEFSCSLKFKKYAAFILEEAKINQFSLSAFTIPTHL